MRNTDCRAARGFLSVPEFARSIGVTEPTVHRWVRAGDLPCVRLGRLVLIPADALQRLLEKQMGSQRRTSQSEKELGE
jgi:excisionase family DNA binding protein